MVNTAFSLNKKRQTNNFDFLRLVAALCIILTHSFGLLKLHYTEFLVILTGQKIDFAFIGLSIFFSISGYLIAKSAATSSSFKNYLWKRFLRIQPLLVVTCIFSIFILGPLFTSISIADYFKESSTYSYLKNSMPVFGFQPELPGVFKDNIQESGVNGSIWTLVVEERLYLFIGILFLMKEKRKPFFIYLVVGLNLIYFLHYTFFNKDLLRYLNGGNVFYTLIFLNSACFFLLNIDFVKKKKSALIFLAAVSILFIASFFSFNNCIQVFAIPLLVLVFAHIKGVTNHIGKYGDFTYGIYIFSFPVAQMLIALKLVNENPMYLFYFTLAIVFPLAIISWNLIEKNMIALKDSVR